MSTQPASAPVTPAPAPMITLAGIDVSNYQGPAFPWNQYRGHIAFAGIKATQALNFLDPDYPHNVQGCRAAGIIPMSYHFLDPTVPGASQARYYLAYADPAPDELVMVDHETIPADMSPAAVAACAVEFVDTTRALVGAWPTVYTTQNMAEGGYCAGLGPCPSFIADPSHVTLPHPIGPWDLVSFTQDGVRGVDTDTFYGARSQLLRLAVVHKVSIPQPPQPKPVALLTSFRLGWMAADEAPSLVKQTSSDGGRTWS